MSDSLLMLLEMIEEVLEEQSKHSEADEIVATIKANFPDLEIIDRFLNLRLEMHLVKAYYNLFIVEVTILDIASASFIVIQPVENSFIDLD